ncbi:MAG: ATP-binding protein [bacterium]
MIGRVGSGRRGALAAAASVAVFEPASLPPEARPAAARVAERVALLAGRRLVVVCDALEEVEIQALLQAWRAHHPWLGLAAQVPTVPGSRRVVHAPPPDVSWRAAQWQAALAADGRHWAPDLPARLAARFDAEPEGMALALADVWGPPRTEALFAALRQRCPHGLDGLARPVTTALGFADLVLPEAALTTLHDIVDHARHREQVLHGWGFDRLLPYGRGLGCLFAGPPGTGKTMVAGILANALDREIYRVDVARLVSKWIGETEKNMARLFEAAERARAILFFDEADSLFGKRTEVKGSNDRFANMEVNDLLQRMERFEGIAILATNLHQSLDEAFRRRFRFIVHFEEPDAAERARLWSRMLPASAPQAGDLDFEALGRRFKLTGGHIKNAVVRAAYGAAAQGRPIDQALLTQAAHAEVRALGRL